MQKLDLGGFGNGTIKFETSTFPGGEIFLRLNTIPLMRHDPVTIYTRLNNSDEIFRLIMAVDALRRSGIKDISAVIPYLPYGRQDRKCNEGEACSLKVFADILNSLNLNEIITWDAHSSVSDTLINNLTDRTNRNFISEVIQFISPSHPSQNLNFICPDQGAKKKINKTLVGYMTPTIHYCDKDRNLGDTGIEGYYVPKTNNDIPCLVIDDLCDGGATFVKLAEEFRRVGNTNKLYLAVTHGIFSKGLDVLKPHYEHVFTTNSRNSDYIKSHQDRPFITQFPLF